MNRLLRISLDTLLMSTMPIIMWILLGIVVDKNIANVFTLTYPIQFITSLILAIFGIGANVNATRNDKKYLVDSNIILGTITGFIVTLFLIFNVDTYINIMSMDVEIYRLFCIYSFSLMYLQLILQMICQKLYYENKNKHSNKLTIIFNLINIILIICLSFITKNQKLSILATLFVDAIIILFIFVRNVKFTKLKFEVLKNMRYVSNDIFDRLGMFIIYFIGWKNTLEFGAIYLVAINFETLIMDAQWDMSYSIITAATIDSSKDEVKYKESLKNGYKLVGLLIASSIIMGIPLYFYYKPILWIVAIFVGVQIIDMFILPKIWIKQQYCQINYSPKITTYNEVVSKGIRIVSSFLPTPFCTYVGQMFSMIYQYVLFNIILRKKYYLQDGLLKMRKKEMISLKKIIPLIICVAFLSACNNTNTEVIGGADQPTNIYVAENNNSEHSFIGTVLEETTTYMIVEPSEDSIERKSSDKIQINYGVDHYDYLYGIGRKVIINYNGFIKETYPAQIYSNDIDHDGYDDFEISVKESSTHQKKKILNNTELYKNNSDFDLYYFGLEEVNVKVNDKEMSLEDALRKGYLTLDGIIAKANQDTDEKKPGEYPYNLMYKDGGSMEYHYDNYTIVKCHTLDGNRDVYICATKTTLNKLNI